MSTRCGPVAQAPDRCVDNTEINIRTNQPFWPHDGHKCWLKCIYNLNNLGTLNVKQSMQFNC